MPAADAERQAFLCCYLALRMDLIEVVTGILPHLVTESNNNLCLGGGALNYAMQTFKKDKAFLFTFEAEDVSLVASFISSGN